MGYFSNILVLIASRGMALAGFFLLPAVTTATDFRQYAMYFAVWQFASQLLSMQVGTTFFRCGLRSVFTRPLTRLLAVFYLLVLLAMMGIISTITSALMVSESSLSYSLTSTTVLIVASFMAVIVASFIVVSEYARAKINERLVFILYLLPGCVYLTLYGVAKYYSFELSLPLLLLVESIAYTVMTLLLLIKCHVSLVLPSGQLTSAIKKLYPFWQRISLPLIPNNLLWYFYFNAPVIIGYQLITQVDEFNEMALLFRFVVAVSTISSMLALVFQKKVISIYEHNRPRYLFIKKTFINIFIPSFLLLSLLLSFVVTILLAVLPVDKSCEVCMVAVNHFDTFIALFYLFFSIYLMSHYFVAEKNMAVISPSMFIGFVVYVVSVTIGLNLPLNFSVTSIYSLCISLVITFIIRYIWLLNQNKSNDKKIPC